VEGLAREQAGLLLELTALSRAQHTAVDARDADALDRVLEKRQGLIDRLAEVADALAGRSGEVESAARARDERGARIARDLAEAARLWTGLAASDRQDLSDLQRQRDELARELAELSRAGRAAGAYGRPAAKGAFFQDTEA
jgi:predicted  nucleic acid-binding Zn-ribbon protein